jgi:Zn-dependent protease
MTLFHLLYWLRLAHPAARWAVSAASLAVFAAVYSAYINPTFGLGITAMLCIHEAGHLLAARWRRVPADPPVFLPFVGALMLIDPEAQHQAGQPDDGAFVAIGGPVLGTAGACACWALGVALQSEALTTAAWAGMALNLFNLIPMAPLDGGQIVEAVSAPLMWSLGLHTLAVLLFVLPEPMLAVLALVVGPLMVTRFLIGDARGPDAAAPLAGRLRWAYGLGYTLLVAVSGLGLIHGRP